MGGSFSKFEKTDWSKADGKLTTAEQTLDNATPTDSFGIYYLTKLGVNQREYSVTDSGSNLLYSTRAVEGTLAWFDVLGPGGGDERLLRVQVDLSRRYWVIYRYGVPSFTGQMWDEEASERVSYRGGWRKPLFRRACITVTWARYHAVVDFYEPADPPDLTGGNGEAGKNTDENVVNSGEEKTTEVVQYRGLKEPNADVDVYGRVLGKPIDDEDRTSDNGDDHEKGVLITREERYGSSDDTTEDVGKECRPAIGSASEELADSDRTTIAPLHDVSSIFRTGEGEIDLAPPVLCHSFDRPTLEEQTSTLGESIRWMQSIAMQSVAAPYRPSNQEEGVITLNKPVLKVQEINSIIGQHQTMLIREKEAQKLKREELLMEAKLARESQSNKRDNDWASDDGILNDLWYEYSYTSNNEDGELGVEVTGASANAGANADDSFEVIRNDGPATLANVCSDSCLLIPSASTDEPDKTTATTVSPTDDGDIDEEPLVGFWTWENSLRIHRMKMHLAAGSDLALHVVLAVVTNQLRYERHATVAVAL